jgi:hypothetical protein
MRWGSAAIGALTCVVVAGAGCGTGATVGTVREGHRLALPEEGSVFDARVRVQGTLSGEPLETLRATMRLWVIRRGSGSVTLRARVHLLASDRTERGYDDVEIVLDERGRVVGTPRSLCASPDFDDLVSTRLVWSVLATGPERGVDGASAPGEIRSELDETSAAVSFALSSSGGAPVGQAHGELELRSAAIAGLVLRGAVHAEVRQRLDDHALIPRRTEIVLRGPVEASSATGTRRGALELRTDSEIEPSSDRAPPAPACALEAAGESDCTPQPGFDTAAVIRMIETRRRAITACYERQLLETPTLTGRLRVAMTVLPSGDVTAVHVVENTTNDAVASCVVDVIDRFQFAPGPTCGAVTFAFPFVFEPADAPAP